MQKIAIDRNSFFGRAYHWYVAQTENQPEGQLDICGVRSVVFFKAPWRWFWSYKIAGTVPIWATAFYTVAIIAVTLALIFSLAVLIKIVIALIVGIVSVVLALAVLVGVISAAIWLNNKLSISERISVWWGKSLINKGLTWLFTRRVGWLFLWIAAFQAWLIVTAVNNLLFDRSLRGILGALLCLLIVWGLAFISRAVAWGVSSPEDAISEAEKAAFWVVVKAARVPVVIAKPAALGTWGAIKLAYQTLKERICLPVEFVG